MQMHYHQIMDEIVQLQSTLTDRYQTTVPDAVRRALKLKKRDRIEYVLRPDGSVLLRKAAEGGDDPALESFLTFLAADIQRKPSRIRALEQGLLRRIQTMTRDIDVDLDAPLSPDDE
jgi:antitoxin PrlF